MAIITHYYCPKCRSEVKGLGWEEGKMQNCPDCGTYISDLNRIHLKVFNENIYSCIFFLILIILVLIFSPKNTFVAYLFMTIVAICLAIIVIILFSRRSTAKSDEYIIGQVEEYTVIGEKLIVYNKSHESLGILTELNIGDKFKLNLKSDFGSFYKVSLSSGEIGYILKKSKFSK
jgi:hypothetical protein